MLINIPDEYWLNIRSWLEYLVEDFSRHADFSDDPLGRESLDCLARLIKPERPVPVPVSGLSTSCATIVGGGQMPALEQLQRNRWEEEGEEMGWW